MNITPLDPPECNILPIDEEAARVLEIQLLDQKIPYCENRCRNIWTDMHRRILICRDCGKAIEAFDYILQWEYEGDQRNKGLRGLKTKIKIAGAEFDELERRINNLRSCLKRAGEPQPQSEREEYRRALLNADAPLQSVVRVPSLK